MTLIDDSLSIWLDQKSKYLFGSSVNFQMQTTEVGEILSNDIKSFNLHFSVFPLVNLSVNLSDRTF